MTPKIQTKRLYRSVFGTPEGQRVLAHMLQDMNFFADKLREPCDVAVADYAKTILRRCGLFPDSLEDAPQMELVLQHLFSMPYEEEK
jgi:hypothetical protein